MWVEEGCFSAILRTFIAFSYFSGLVFIPFSNALVTFTSVSTDSSRHTGFARSMPKRQQSLHVLPISPFSDGHSASEEALLESVKTSLGEIEFELHSAISEIPAEAWDNCLVSREDETLKSPFLEHAWLRCLEESGCASEETGWIPQHVSFRIKSDKAINIDGAVNNVGTQFMDGFVPLYIKNHSMGEFIFDNSWADAADRNDMEYYPKLLVGVPFTPVTGPRILWQPWVWGTFSTDDMAELRRTAGNFLKQLALSRGWSSVHINFCTNEEATILAGPLQQPQEEEEESTSSYKRNPMTGPFQAMLRQIRYKDSNDYLRRTSIQYHWKNNNKLKDGKPFDNFEDYLACFRSKRRIAIRRERAKVKQESHIRIDAISGREILQVDGLMERMFDIYVSTVNKMHWGRQYLTPEFFKLLSKSTFVENLCFLCARYNNKLHENGDPSSSTKVGNGFHSIKSEDVFAGTFNVIKGGVFYGRYWGCLQGHDVKNLHFETCYWSAIEYCIEHGLKRMEPGAGGAGRSFFLLNTPFFDLNMCKLTHSGYFCVILSLADYKWARGFDPALIHSVHYICNPGLRRAVWQFLDSETEYNVALSAHLLERSSVANSG